MPKRTTIKVVKKHLEIATGIPIYFQILSYIDDMELDGEETLLFYKVVHDKSVLTLRIMSEWLPALIPTLQWTGDSEIVTRYEEEPKMVGFPGPSSSTIIRFSPANPPGHFNTFRPKKIHPSYRSQQIFSSLFRSHQANRFPKPQIRQRPIPSCFRCREKETRV